MKIGQIKNALDDYVNYKYQNPEGIHHYETIEQTHKGNIILEEGTKVPEQYPVYYSRRYNFT